MVLNPDACYDALRTHDPRFDGVFFTGVRTTGIYCRPVCPARTPLRSSCEFFETAAAAEAQHFRPCLRCRPELAPGNIGNDLAAELLQRIQQRAVEGVRLSDLDRELGLSARQVRRILNEAFGVSPTQIAQTQRLLLAKQLIEQTQEPLSEIALSAGFRSLRRFNALFQERYRSSPSAWRKSQRKAKDQVDGITLRLAYRPPLAWKPMMDYFRSRLVPGVEEIEGEEYRRTVQLGNATGWIRVWPTPKEDSLSVTISPSLARAAGAVQWRIRRMFDLDAEPQAIAAKLSQDLLLQPIIERYPGLRVGGAWDIFELAVRAVLGQQITVAAATTLSGRLAKAVGSAIETPFENLHHLAVTPEDLEKLNTEELCRLGLVRARAETLRHLAVWSRQGELEFAPGSTHEAVVARLTAQPGIGPWTANYIAMRALRYPDAFPAGDLGLRKAIGQGTLISTKEAEQRSQVWKPWRAYAAITLWKSLTP